MLKLYTNIDLLNETTRSYVFPLLFDLVFNNNHEISNYYEIVNVIEDSDIAVFPLEYSYSLINFKKALKSFIKKAKSVNKKIWVYTGGDYGYSLKDDDIYVFRLGGFKSKFNHKTIVLPSFIDDPFQKNITKSLISIKKSSRPKIGFVGHAAYGIPQYIKELKNFFNINFKRFIKKEIADFQPFYPSSIKRLKQLKQFMKSKEIDSNFILRSKYRAGVKTETERKKTTLEFYNNIYESPYTFCMRGNGNFSVRLYETLAVGRIPVLLDTDCELPLETLIDWQNHLVWIDDKDKDQVADKLLEFHNNISENDFILLQKRNRELWNKFLTRHGFFRKIHDMFININ